MNYLNLNSTKIILEKVAANNGKLTWYGIVKDVSQLEDVELDPPAFYVLQELNRQGFLKLDPPEEENSAKYWLTESGQAFLSQIFSVSDSRP